MKQFSWALLALAVLLVVGCGRKPEQEMKLPTPVPTPVVLTFDQRVEKLNPSLQKYVKALYRDYGKNAYKYQGPSKLKSYISEVHKKAEKQYHIVDPINDKEVGELAYGIDAYSLRWKSDKDINVSFITHESGFLDIIGDRTDKKTGKPNPPERWSVGPGQVQIDTAKGDLKTRGYDPTGLTTDDLLYFRLMNLDISICVMSSEIHHHGLKKGIRIYNGGENGWTHKNTKQYYKDVMAVYKKRSKWKEPTE